MSPYFAKNNSHLRRRFDVANANYCELFATAKNFSHLRKIFRKNGEFWAHLRIIFNFMFMFNFIAF